MGAVPKPHQPEVMRPTSDHTKTGFNAATIMGILKHSLDSFNQASFRLPMAKFSVVARQLGRITLQLGPTRRLRQQLRRRRPRVVRAQRRLAPRLLVVTAVHRLALHRRRLPPALRTCTRWFRSSTVPLPAVLLCETVRLSACCLADSSLVFGCFSWPRTWACIARSMCSCSLH